MTCSSWSAGKKGKKKHAFGFGFAAHWLKRWREILKPLSERHYFRQPLENCCNSASFLWRCNLLFQMIRLRSCLLRCWFAALFNWSLFRPLITWYSFQRRVGEKMPKISLLRRYGQASWQKRSIVLKPLELHYCPAICNTRCRPTWVSQIAVSCLLTGSFGCLNSPLVIGQRDYHLHWWFTCSHSISPWYWNSVEVGSHVSARCNESRFSNMLNLWNNFLPFFTSLLSCLEITREVGT